MRENNCEIDDVVRRMIPDIKIRKSELLETVKGSGARALLLCAVNARGGSTMSDFSINVSFRYSSRAALLVVNHEYGEW
jgi:predicted xylose isomerase-like sugar epimerase